MKSLNKLRFIASLLVLSPVLGLFFSCSDNPPEIIQFFNQPNVIRDETTGDMYQQFSVFLHLEDEDGTDDIESIYLIHDSEELFWELNAENWITVTTDNETWIGSNGIAFPPSVSPARGLFRVVVIDAAGERTAEELYLQPPAERSRIPFPILDSSGDGSLFIKNSGREHTLWYYDQSGGIIDSIKTADRTIPAPESADRIASIYVYTYSDEYGCGVISGPYQMPDS